MNARQIGERIQVPESILPEELGELQELAAKYPYTQVFSILFLMALGRRNDLRFEEELLKHSYRIGDRVQLYELIRVQEAHAQLPIIEQLVEREQTLPQETQNEIVEIVPEAEELEEVPSEVRELPIVEVINPAWEEVLAPTAENSVSPISEIETPLSETDELLDEKKQAPNFIEEEYIEEEEAIEVGNDAAISLDPPEAAQDEETSSAEEEEDEVELDPLEATILQHAVAAAYRLEDLNEEEIARLANRDNQVIPDEPFQLQKAASEVEADSRQSFNSWLGANKNYVPDEKEDESAIRALVNDFSAFDPSQNLYGEVEKPKQEFFSPTKKARESLREDDLPVSETLAKIYVMQGNYPKAIESYTQLSLKYPEKKIFFANLIAELTQKLNIK